MGKMIKGTSSRRPPVPAKGHAEIAGWMETVMPAVKPIVERLDAIIRKELKGLQYAVKWQHAFYGLPDEGWIIEIGAYHVSANIVFHGGAEFDDPPELGEGARYVKLRSVEEANAQQIRAWIREARRHSGWK